jgi:hypothetical protein
MTGQLHEGLSTTVASDLPVREEPFWIVRFDDGDEIEVPFKRDPWKASKDDGEARVVAVTKGSRPVWRPVVAG